MLYQTKQSYTTSNLLLKLILLVNVSAKSSGLDVLPTKYLKNISVFSTISCLAF